MIMSYQEFVDDAKNGQESSKNITEVFLGANMFLYNLTIISVETDDISDGITSSTLTVDDNLLHHTVEVTDSDGNNIDVL